MYVRTIINALSLTSQQDTRGKREQALVLIRLGTGYGINYERYIEGNLSKIEF